jgi:methionyl-tRNA formyltransferase
MSNYIIASIKNWNINAFAARRAQLPGRWLIITDPLDLTIDLIRTNAPRYIFFMHWSSIVPKEILEVVECVCFHMTDVPYGRGGSPLQNLIASGHTETKLTALQMTKDIDAGPVYGKLSLSLQGSAADIFNRCAELGLELIEHIVREEPKPTEQVGEPFLFHRRTPEQSMIPTKGELVEIYDHIRMLDAETYPPAFINHGRFRITFSGARLDKTSIIATAHIFLGSNSK